jgi:RNA polymerase sigma factor (sigma-70 family)
MDASTGEEPPPLSTDLAGWRQAVADGRFRPFSLEAIAAAIQDLRPNRDGGLIRDLVKHLSDSVYRIVRAKVWYSHPNRGDDIVERVCDQFWVALFQPQSADGKGIRQALRSRLEFRVKDAIAAEARARRVPHETAAKPPKGPPKAAAPTNEGGEEIDLDEIGTCAGLEDEIDALDDEWAPSKTGWNPTLLAGVRAADEQIDVDRFLKDNIADDRQRLAFRLYMDGLPFKAKKYDSIAKALELDERTVRRWIKDIKAQLKKKIGDLT